MPYEAITRVSVCGLSFRHYNWDVAGILHHDERICLVRYAIPLTFIAILVIIAFVLGSLVFK